MPVRFFSLSVMLALGLALFWGCVVKKSSTAVVKDPGLVLISPAFGHGEAIPARYTCDGRDISPALKWSEPPEGTRSFMLVASGPDAEPDGGRTLWVLTGIPAGLRSLPEAVSAGRFLENGLRQRANSWGKNGYKGPCPKQSGGNHRYLFRLYALDVGPEVEMSESLAEARALGTATLVGHYGR